MRISDWSSDVCSSDLTKATVRDPESFPLVIPQPVPGRFRRVRGAGGLRDLLAVPVEPAAVPAVHLPAHRLRRARAGAAGRRPARAEGGDRASRVRDPGAGARAGGHRHRRARSEEHTSELQSLMRISYAVFCLKKKKKKKQMTD